MSEAYEVGKKLCEMCNGANRDTTLRVLDELYDDGIVSVEAVEGGEEMPRELRGIDAIRGKSNWWYDNHEVHSAKCDGPYPHVPDKFAAIFDMDVTPKAGPMAGQRFQMREVGLYTVKNGKVVREEFFYHMGG